MIYKMRVLQISQKRNSVIDELQDMYGLCCHVVLRGKHMINDAKQQGFLCRHEMVPLHGFLCERQSGPNLQHKGTPLLKHTKESYH